MSTRTIIIVCVGCAAFLIIGCAGMVFLAFRYLMPSRMGMPPQLAQPSVVTGEGLFQKRLFLDDLAVGQVTDILFRETAEPMIGVAGLRGAVWATRDGQVTSSVSIPSGATHVDFFDVDGDGKFEFLNRGGSGWQTASLIDANGTTLWTCDRGSGVDDMAAGDLGKCGILMYQY
ncbi:MAG: hypothetical protein IH899_12775 [Planctomycetes bacterium]|nr:hypothetical protein [Planctomycetota bacterium]